MAEIQLGAVEARFADIIWEREPVTSDRKSTRLNSSHIQRT